MNGSLEATSTYGKGSIFTFRFKTEKTATKLDASSNDIINFKKRMRIKIAKNNAKNKKIYTAIGDMLQIVELQEENDISPFNESNNAEFSVEEFEDELKPELLSKVIVADDQDINLEVLKQFFESLNVTNISYCVNGKIAIDTCKSEIAAAIMNANEMTELQPLSLVILDF